MSATLQVITNSHGSSDRCVVYETRCGEVIFDGHYVTATELFNILSIVNGGYDEVQLVELTNSDMANWQDHL